MKFLCTLVLALVLHLLLGWAWTWVAALAGGYWKGRRGWLMAAGAVGAAWLALVLYTMAVAPDATMRLLGIIGGIMGGLPGLAAAMATVLVGVLLGTAGGGLGSRLRLLADSRGA